MDNANYLTYNIADRPTLKQVFDGSGAQLSKTTYAYDGQLPTQTSGVVQHDYTKDPYTFNIRGNLTSKQDWYSLASSNAPTTFVYDDTGQLLSTTDPGGHTTSYSYGDSFLNGTPPGPTNAYATTITYPTTANGQAHVETKSYFYHTGQVAQSRDQNSQQTSFTYGDSLLRLTRTDFPDGGAEVRNYLDASHEVEVRKRLSGGTSPDAGWSDTYQVVDGLGRGVRSCALNAQGTWDTSDTEWDGVSEKHKASAAYSSSSCAAWGGVAGATGDVFSYDGLGRTTQVQHIDGTTATTQYAGPSTKIADETGRSRILRSDGLGRLVAVCEVTSHSGSAACGNNFSATGYLTDYGYSGLGNLTSVWQTANATRSRGRSFAYDWLSRLTQAVNPESGTINYGYNSDSLLTSKTSPAPNQTGATTITASYTYDELHRMLSRAYNDGNTPGNNYAYDKDADNGAAVVNGIGRETKETNPRGWVKTTQFDPVGRIANQTRLIDAGNWYTSFLYYYDGNLKQAVSPDNVTVNYGAPDVQGRPVNASFPGGSVNRAFSLAAAAAPAMTTSDTYPGALSRARVTNNRFQPASIHVQNGGTTLLNLTLGYSSACQSANNGNIAVQTYTDATTTSYCYNDLNQFVNSTGKISESFDYDPYGNRTDLAANGNNQPTASGYASDAAGNLTAIPGHALRFFSDEEVQNVDNGGTVYTYDGHERRFEANLSGTERTFYYVGDSDRVMSEYYAPTGWTDYVYLGGERIASLQGGVPNYYFTDHLGSTAVMTDQNGNLLPGHYPQAYTAFGMDQPGYTPPPERRRFTGKERDAESGLDYFEARYYGSAMGRFMSPDWSARAEPVPYAKLDDPQSLNLYAYVRNNPLTRADPDGHDGEGDGEGEGQRGGIVYKPGVPAASPEVGSMLNCTASCSNQTLRVTSTSESIKEHPPGTPHAEGKAADVTVKPGTENQVTACAKKCGARFTQDEVHNPIKGHTTGPHVHLQTVPGKRHRKTTPSPAPNPAPAPPAPAPPSPDRKSAS